MIVTPAVITLYNINLSYSVKAQTIGAYTL